MIGLFDSGVGGLSVWKELVKIMPDESFSIIIPPYSGKVLKICQRKETEELSFLF